MRIIQLFFVLFFSFLVFEPNYAKAEAPERSKEEIFEYWSNYGRATFHGSPYAQKPSPEDPYTTGSLKEGFLQDGLHSLNFVRYLTGLPADVELDSSLVSLDQHGAVLLAAVNELSHYPHKPTDMPDKFYSDGTKATSASNLGMGYRSIENSIFGYVDDSDSSNIASLGHRRWVLNPTMKKTGFGYAEAADGQAYTSMWAVDESRKDTVSYDHISYPSNGYFPLEYFAEYTPWSVSLNPEEYDRASLDEVQVTLTRKSDGKSWTLNKEDSNDYSDEFFTVSPDYYGEGDCIIFRVPLQTISDGDAFHVEITGLHDHDGKEKKISYDVNFFKMIKAVDLEPETVLVEPNKPVKYKIYAYAFNGSKMDITNDIALNITGSKDFTYDNGLFTVRGNDEYDSALLYMDYAGLADSQEIIIDKNHTNISISMNFESIQTESTEISGIFKQGYKIKLEKQAGNSRELMAETIVKQNGTFSIPISRQPADTILYVSALDSHNHAVDSQELTVSDITPPSFVDLEPVTNYHTFIMGKTEPNAHIKVYLNANERAIAEGSADSEGNFAVPIDRQMPGTIITVEATDSSQNSRFAIQTVLDYKGVKPAVVKDLSDSDHKMEGTAEPFAKIKIEIEQQGNRRLYQELAAGGNGTFSLAVDHLNPDTKFFVTVTDSSGKSSFPVLVIVKDKTPPASPEVADIFDNQTSISGTAEAGSIITVAQSGMTLGSATTNSEGQFSVTIPIQKAGTTLTVTASDKAGNTSDVAEVTAKDITPPATPFVNAVNDNTISITGQAESSTKVYAMVGNKKIGETTAKNGQYTIKMAKQKAGTSIILYAVDPAGNKSGSKAIKVIDKTPPSVPTVNKITSKSITVIGKGEKVATVYIYNGSKKIGQGTVDSRGNFKIKIKAQKKSSTLKVYAQDKSGNKSKSKTIKVS